MKTGYDKESKILTFFYWLLCAVLALSFGYLQTRINETDQKIKDLHYCEMVELWNNSRGENGHPDYKGNAGQTCAKN